ncbi:OmpA family protein [Pseudomonas subflava]|uniref:OmpA family protein n=1 Tax=Pseudomonas subflava TaxID=2952933 RepID=UPI0020793262|nr:OmpA family protein [Pseudomonas subflava]
MPSLIRNGGLLLSLALLAGCASQQSQQVLTEAELGFQQVKEDPDVLRSAPKDVIRAGESLARAERLSSYWGSAEDVEHYAYLSQRYSQIARQHAELNLNQERLAKLELERERLQLALREAKLLSAQQQGQWLEEQMVSLAASETDRGLVMTLGDVLFDAGRTELKPSANRTILKLVQFLQINPRRAIRIEGYTDNSGVAAENLELSRARAQAVADMLADLGIDPDRMEVKGYGEAHPLAENASSKGRAQNRRVEILISDEQGKLGDYR